MNILVIAFKFNDILYSSKTKEYIEANDRHLLIFSELIDKKNFPLSDDFSNISYIKIKKNRLNQFLGATKFIAKNVLTKKYNFVILSNPFVNITRLILAKIKIEKILLIEDGAMNYYDSIGKKSWIRFIAEIFLGTHNVEKKIVKTYLINPDNAFVYFGEKSVLNLIQDKKFTPKEIELINVLKNKNILLGGGAIELIALAEQIAIYYKIINNFNIDMYIPHHTSVADVVGVNKISVADYSSTLEHILPWVGDCVIYSFGSSVVINAIKLNPGIRVVLLKMGKSLDLHHKFYSLMERSCSEIFYVDEINE